MLKGKEPDGQELPEKEPDGQELPEDESDGQEQPEKEPDGQELPEDESDGQEQPENEPDHDPCYPWKRFFSGSCSAWTGWVPSFEAVNEIVQVYETHTNTSFVKCGTRGKGIDKAADDDKNHFIRFKDPDDASFLFPERLKFDGVPFKCINYSRRECDRGMNRVKTSAESDKADHNYKRPRKRLKTQPTKKINCSASILIRQVVRYPDFAVNADTKSKKRSASEKLRTQLKKSAETVKSEIRWYIYLPNLESHNHDLCLVKSIDERLKQRIFDLVAEGIDSTTIVKRYILEFVKENRYYWFANGVLPPESNRKFFPTNDTIQSHINLALSKYRHSQIDQEHLDMVVKEWNDQDPGLSYHFRPYISSDNSTKSLYSQTFLFIYQSESHKHLMNRYGNELCILDATYRTTEYALPLFLIVVKTNVDYQPVAAFVTTNETTEMIAEALSILKEWNSEWQPKYFMTDFSEQDIQAVEKVFPDTATYFCDFHCVQVWERFVSCKGNGVRPFKNEVILQLREVAHAETQESLQIAIEDLKNSTNWKKSRKLVKYFQETWEPVIEKWSWCYRRKGLLVILKTDNGTEKMNDEFQNNILKGHRDKTVSEMLNVLHHDYFPEKVSQYVYQNVSCLSTVESYSHSVQSFLHNRPKAFVLHCRERIAYAEAICYVREIQTKVFHVESETHLGTFHSVTFASSTEDTPDCDCDDWKHFLWPCKHMFAVLGATRYWWNDIGDSYINSVFHTLDSTATTSVESTIPDELLE